MIKSSKLSHDWFPEPIPQNVQIGERSWLYSSFAFLHYKSRQPCGVCIGHDTGLYNGTFFDLGPDGEVQIGNYCTLVGAIIATNNRVVIGDYSFVAHEVVIADSYAAVPGIGSNLSEQKQASSDQKDSVIISENVWIGARSVILAGAHIGEGAIVGAASVINCDVPAYAVVAGNPARIRAWAH